MISASKYWCVQRHKLGGWKIENHVMWINRKNAGGHILITSCKRRRSYFLSFLHIYKQTRICNIVWGSFNHWAMWTVEWCKSTRKMRHIHTFSPLFVLLWSVLCVGLCKWIFTMTWWIGNTISTNLFTRFFFLVANFVFSVCGGFPDDHKISRIDAVVNKKMGIYLSFVFFLYNILKWFLGIFYYHTWFFFSSS